MSGLAGAYHVHTTVPPSVRQHCVVVPAGRHGILSRTPIVSVDDDEFLFVCYDAYTYGWGDDDDGHMESLACIDMCD